MNKAIVLQTRSCPEPNRPFVNRLVELQIIQRKIEEGSNGDPMPLVVTCFWGAFGMGKSWLLLELERRFRNGDVTMPAVRSVITARLDLSIERNPALWVDKRIDRENLLRELWKQLATQLHLLNELTPELEGKGLEQWVDNFVNVVTAWSSKNTPLIMLDTMDDLLRLDEQAFFWLEQNVVERLTLTGRVLFVFTSRGELRQWKRFQVRRQVDSRRLFAFDEKTAGKVVGANRFVSKELFQHSFGHPLVTDWLGTAIENSGVHLRDDKYDHANIDKECVQKVLQEAVKSIFKPIEEIDHVLIMCISVLRWMTIESLKFILEKLELVDLGHADAHFSKLITQLQENHILYWNGSRKSYEFDPVIRHLISHFLEIDNPEQFQSCHQAAFEFHRNHLDTKPDYLARYVPELAYHRKILEQFRSIQTELPSLQEWWTDFLQRKAPSDDPEPWSELFAALKPDEELRQLSPPEYEQLLQDSLFYAKPLLN
jgi:hypothetical protein